MRGPLLAVACLWVALTGACSPAAQLQSGPVRSLGSWIPDDNATRMVRSTRGPSLGAAIAGAAKTYLSEPPSGFRADCSGFVEAVLHRAGLPIRGSTAQFWEQSRRAGTVHRRRRPYLGDLVFFDHTWDRNGNGRRDDDLTHIAVVIDVEKDGTVVMAHKSSSRGRTTLRMNLLQPDVTAVGSHRVNDHLRRASGDRREPTLAAQLWRGFATLRDAP